MAPAGRHGGLVHPPAWTLLTKLYIRRRQVCYISSQKAPRLLYPTGSRELSTRSKPRVSFGSKELMVRSSPLGPRLISTLDSKYAHSFLSHLAFLGPKSFDFPGITNGTLVPYLEGPEFQHYEFSGVLRSVITSVLETSNPGPTVPTVCQVTPMIIVLQAR